MENKRRVRAICVMAYGLLLFCACGSSDSHKDDLPSAMIQEIPAEGADEEGGTRNETEPETVQENTCTEKTSWQEAYYEMVKRSDLWELLLVDINFDRIPELFTVYLDGNTANVYISQSYSFEKDGVVWIDFGEFGVPNDIFVPYRNKSSEEIVWIVDVAYRVAHNEYICTWHMYDFADLSNVEQTVIFKYTKIIEEGMETYLDAEGEPISFAEIEEQKEAVFADYEQEETGAVARWFGRNIDREEFMEFCASYEKLQEVQEKGADEKGGIRNDSEPEIMEETPTEENGILEVYADGNVISVLDDIMIAQISPQEILAGDPILYDRFRIDGWVFEWMISDYCDEESRGWLENGVLVISGESDREDFQIIHVTAEGGYAVWVSAENKFEYVDVNFDDIPDLLICTGHHGNQGLLTYYCFLQTEDGFVEAPTFTDISNPAIDADNQLILSQWRNSACSHSWAEYRCQDHSYVMDRELCEDLQWEDYDGEEVWIWTVNGEVIGRSDELTREEIDDLIYNENSEWGISGDRWRTIYNHGLTTDYSIYSEP